VIFNILHLEPLPLHQARPDLPEPLVRVARRALAKDVADRYPDMAALLADLNSPDTGPASGVTQVLPPPPVRRRPWAPPAAVAACAVVLAGGGVLALRSLKRPAAAGRPASGRAGQAVAAAAKRLAVLPFANAGDDAASDYVGISLASRVIERLSYVEGLAIRPASATRAYQDEGVDPVAAGRTLRVDYVLTGRFRSDPRTMALTFDLHEVASGARVLQESAEVPRADAFRLQDLVARKVVTSVGIEASADGSRVPLDVPGSPLAYQLYLRSLSFPDTVDGHRLALAALEEALSRDPAYAPTHAELGHRLRGLAVYGLAGREVAARAEEAFRAALALNGGLLAARGGLSGLYAETGESAKAVELLRETLDSHPGHAPTHFSLSYVYRYGGMLHESAAEGEKAMSLDPNNPRYRSVATTYLYLGDLDRALEVHKLDPESPWTQARMGQIFLRRGQTRLAREHLERAIAREPESSTGRWALAMRAHLLGRRKEGLAALERNERAGMVDGEQWYHMANVHALLGDRAGCLRALRQAVEAGFINHPFMARDSFLDPLRADPAFQGILDQARTRHEAFKARFFPAAPAGAPPPSLGGPS
jgi:TolB-like protein/Tfp pilus assembly protein PilF